MPSALHALYRQDVSLSRDQPLAAAHHTQQSAVALACCRSFTSIPDGNGGCDVDSIDYIITSGWHGPSSTFALWHVTTTACASRSLVLSFFYVCWATEADFADMSLTAVVRA